VNLSNQFMQFSIFYLHQKPDLPFPPQPILTRWCTWLQAAVFYSKHFAEVKSLRFNGKDGAYFDIVGN
jgi:hypothetical protein